MTSRHAAYPPKARLVEGNTDVALFQLIGQLHAFRSKPAYMLVQLTRVVGHETITTQEGDMGMPTTITATTNLSYTARFFESDSTV
jgi:hypothetical protein